MLSTYIQLALLHSAFAAAALVLGRRSWLAVGGCLAASLLLAVLGLTGAPLWLRVIHGVSAFFGLLLVPLIRGELSGLRGFLVVLASFGGLLVLYADSTLLLLVGLETCSAALVGLVASVEPTAGVKYAVFAQVAGLLVALGAILSYSHGGDVLSGGAAAPVYAVVLLLAGVAFEAGIAPFHAWLPDVAEAAPRSALIVSTLLVDPPVLTVLYKLARAVATPESAVVTVVLLFLAVASMAIGELTALMQESVRRMLGFSMVSDAGYSLLLAIAAALTGRGAELPLALFITASAASLSTAFTAVERGERILDALALAASLLSLAGIPPFYGFTAKFLMLSWLAGSTPALAALAALFFVIAAAYNVRCVVSMFKAEVLKPTRYYTLAALTLIVLGLMAPVIVWR